MAKLVQLNLERERKKDLLLGRGIEIYDQTFSSVKDKKIKNYHGLQSSFFATDWEDGDIAFMERYRCDCGKTNGGYNEGSICPHCFTEVTFKGVDVKKTGWMVIKDYHIISPVCYKKITSLITKSKLYLILGYNPSGKKTNTDAEKKVPAKYLGMGMIEFKDNFEEVMEWALSKNKKKIDIYEEIMELHDKGCVFTNSIPVITSILRPYSNSNGKLHFSPLSLKYEPLRSLVVTLNSTINDKLIDHDLKLYSKRLLKIQIRYMLIYDEIFEAINGKNGHIRSQILGGRCNFSARNVIVSNDKLRANEVTLSYHTILDLYKYELCSYLIKYEHKNPSDAINEIAKAKVLYNEKIHEIMRYLIKTHEYRVAINRNPSIDHGSFLCMIIKEVTHNSDTDFTMGIPIQALGVLNADFDGDILNIYALKTKKIVKEFKKIDPTETMFISNNDGLFNNSFNLIKDQMISLYQFNNI